MKKMKLFDSEAFFKHRWDPEKNVDESVIGTKLG